MTALYFVRPFTVQPLVAQKPQGQAIEGQPWGTPSEEEMERLLDTIEYALDRALIRRTEVVHLLSECHLMMLRCQAALPAVTEPSRGEEVAA